LTYEPIRDAEEETLKETETEENEGKGLFPLQVEREAKELRKTWKESF